LIRGKRNQARIFDPKYFRTRLGDVGQEKTRLALRLTWRNIRAKAPDEAKLTVGWIVESYAVSCAKCGIAEDNNHISRLASRSNV
jgi:hypothetical protein